MQKKILSSVLAVIMIIAMCSHSQAQEIRQRVDEETEQVLLDEGYTILQVEQTSLSEHELQDYVNVRSNVGKDSLTKKNVAVSAIRYHYQAEKDGHVDDIYLIQAKASEKYSIGQSGELIGTICWRDNAGPSNDLIYVAGTYPSGTYSSKVNTYEYRKVGFYNSTVYGTWVGGYFTEYVSSYSGLQFTLSLTAGDLSVQVYTSPFE